MAVRPFIKIDFLLKKPSAPATADDLGVVQDMLDTLKAHEDDCVGLAANMIGVRKRIIAFTDYGTAKEYSDDLIPGPNRVMLNPEITQEADPYTTAEGCMCLKDMHTAVRFEHITVRYQDTSLAWHEEDFEGFTAQVIQHQIDHCNGVLI